MNAITAITPPAECRATDWFRTVIERERDALGRFLGTRQAGIAEAVALIAEETHPITLTGIGKSGHIAAKIAATFSSLGTPAAFINAAEAAHGDLGAVAPGGVVILISNSGSTDEILRMLPLLKARGCTLVGIIGRGDSPLARAVDHLILAEIAGEADHIGMAPTTSTTLHLAIGDALAVAVSRMRGFTAEDFLRHHPAGLLGRRTVPVTAVMRQGEELPVVGRSTDLIDLLAVMSAKRMGAACVVDANGVLAGLVVDGDVRRHLQSARRMAGVTAGELMHRDPRVTGEDATIGDILAQRTSDASGWLVLPVVDAARRLKGMVHLHDLDGGAA